MRSTITMNTMKLSTVSVWSLSIAALAGLAASAFGQDRGSAEVTFGEERVVIDYGRPTLRGRDVETALPPGMLWRMGMNQATTFETSVRLAFEDGVEIPPGTYSLYLRKLDEERFRLIVNRQTGQWGTQYDAAHDVASIPLERAELEENVEQFTITLERRGQGDKNAELRLAWGHLSLSLTFGARAR